MPKLIFRKKILTLLLLTRISIFIRIDIENNQLTFLSSTMCSISRINIIQSNCSRAIEQTLPNPFKKKHLYSGHLNTVHRVYNTVYSSPC